MTSQAACARYPKGRAAAGGGGAVVGGAVRGHDMDIPWSRVAATPRLRVGSSAAVGHKRTEAWIFRGGESRRPQFYGHLEPFGSRAGGNPAAFVAKLSAEEAGAIVERAEALRVEADAASNEYDPPPGAP